MIPGFFSNEVQKSETKSTETGDLVDYAEIPGFSGEIVKFRVIIEKKPGILKTIAFPNDPRFLLQGNPEICKRSQQKPGICLTTPRSPVSLVKLLNCG